MGIPLNGAMLAFGRWVYYNLPTGEHSGLELPAPIRLKMQARCFAKRFIYQKTSNRPWLTLLRMAYMKPALTGQKLATIALLPAGPATTTACCIKATM